MLPKGASHILYPKCMQIKLLNSVRHFTKWISRFAIFLYLIIVQTLRGLNYFNKNINSKLPKVDEVTIIKSKVCFGVWKLKIQLATVINDIQILSKSKCQNHHLRLKNSFQACHLCNFYTFITKQLGGYGTFKLFILLSNVKQDL